MECFLAAFEQKIPLGTDEVSMLTHTYPHKPLRKISDHMQLPG